MHEKKNPSKPFQPNCERRIETVVCLSKYECVTTEPTCPTHTRDHSCKACSPHLQLSNYAHPRSLRNSLRCTRQMARRRGSVGREEDGMGYTEQPETKKRKSTHESNRLCSWRPQHSSISEERPNKSSGKLILNVGNRVLKSNRD